MKGWCAASSFLLLTMTTLPMAQAGQENNRTAHETTTADQTSNHETRLFSGAWFEVRYPADFSAEGSLESNIPDKYDSARFTSPDGSVSFYVYSPQWSGEASDIALRDDEREVSREVKRSEKATITYWTIESHDGRRTRSYQQTLEHISTASWVFGIEYTDMEAYQRHRPAYLQFKNSLQQFAD